MTRLERPMLEFFFDYGSPFSYLADTQLPGVAKRSGAAVVYRPMLLGAVLKATGNASPMTVPAKGRYMIRDLQRWTKRYGVPFQSSPFSFVSNTLRIMRGAVASQRLGSFDRYHGAVFAAAWGEPKKGWCWPMGERIRSTSAPICSAKRSMMKTPRSGW